MELKPVILTSDILIIGGGTAGCYAALTIAEQQAGVSVLIAEKANIKRSGCLAAGVNALNAYIVKGQTPEAYLNYAKNDAEGIVREDLLLTMAEGLNRVTHKLESLGLVILKDANGEYVARGNRNIKINGENIKPLLADAVELQSDIRVLNRVNIIDYILKEGRVIGAYGFSIETNTFYVLYAKAVICATGGAAGLYRPNNPGFSRHKMWYPPFNTGGGYAMGIRAGAEMTTFEMRFIALRCKDTIAPTGTIAQGVRAEQVNSMGGEYERKYGTPKTSNRLYSTVMENKAGRGPCYLATQGISKEQEQDLFKAYLNMAPSQTLRWLNNGRGPAEENVEIEGTEPYIVGGHTASGYWVDTHRSTTLRGLFAAGDVAGGCPQKYVTGCLVEGEIAAFAALRFIQEAEHSADDPENPDRSTSDAFQTSTADIDHKLQEVNSFLGISESIGHKVHKGNQRLRLQRYVKSEARRSRVFFKNSASLYALEEIEEAMQKVMDEYAGGISAGYVVNAEKLRIAAQRIEELLELSLGLRAKDLHELMFIYEILDRLTVSRVLIKHLEARKETRWHSFHEYADYPQQDDENWLRYVNSYQQDGEIKILLRDLVKKDEIYEHKN